MIKLRAEALLDKEQFTYDFIETEYAGHARALAQQISAAARRCWGRAQDGFVDAVVIEEHRRILGVAGTRRAVPVARLRWRAARGCWTLEHADRSGTMRRYRPLPASRSFIELLREFDADPAGLFWGRIDGKSLRWCRPEGRCAPCEAKYCDVLGMPCQLQAGQAPMTPGADAAGGAVSS